MNNIVATNKTAAKAAAMVIRNALEDFHVEHLSDKQMSQLNPIIRNALFTYLEMVDEHKNGNATISKLLQFNLMSIPDYWEEPEVLDDYKEFL